MTPNHRKSTFFSTRMIVSIILIVFFCAVQFLFLRLSAISVKIAWADSLILLLLALLFTKGIETIQRYYHSNEVLNTTNVSTVILFGIITGLLSHIIGSNLFQSDITYIQFLNYSGFIRTVIIILSYFIILIIFWMEQQQFKMESLNRKAIDNERIKNEIELNYLQQQLRPHFLFNSLNSIHALLQKDKEEAGKMLLLLSDFMRNSLNNKGNFVSFGEEAELISKYLQIEEVRFGNRLKVAIEIQEDSVQQQIPTFLLQPLIENSVKYGVYGSTDKVLIKITAKKVNQNLQIEIQNPFDDEAQKSMKGTGFGITSVQKKLSILFGRNDLLEIISVKNLYIVRILIPQYDQSATH